MFYRMILIPLLAGLMLPVIALGQYETESVPSIDTFYIDFCDSNSVGSGDDNKDGWLLSGATLYIDTSEGAGGGEANVLSDSGTYNGTEGFGLAAGKTGVALKVKGLIEGSNITITTSADSGLVITAGAGAGLDSGEVMTIIRDTTYVDSALVGQIISDSTSGVWTERSDTLFAVDTDDDTVAVFWDDDAGNVRWQVATEDQTLGILIDSLFSAFINITNNDATLKFEDDSGNYGIMKVGNSQVCIAADPEDLVASSDICFDIDGDEVARFHQNTNFAMGMLIPPEKISIVGNIALGDTVTGDTDAYISFGDDNAWPHTLKFDDGLDQFQFNNDLDITGVLTGDSAQFDGNVDIDSMDVNGVANFGSDITINGRTETGNKHWIFNVFSPNLVYDDDTQICIDPGTEAALTVTRIDVTLDADPTTELEYSLKFADAFIGLAGATVIEDTATVAGITTVYTITGDATVPVNKAIYIQFEADPDANITQMSVDVTWDYD